MVVQYTTVGILKLFILQIELKDISFKRISLWEVKKNKTELYFESLKRRITNAWNHGPQLIMLSIWETIGL